MVQEKKKARYFMLDLQVTQNRFLSFCHFVSIQSKRWMHLIRTNGHIRSIMNDHSSRDFVIFRVEKPTFISIIRHFFFIKYFYFSHQTRTFKPEKLNTINQVMYDIKYYGLGWIFRQKIISEI